MCANDQIWITTSRKIIVAVHKIYFLLKGIISQLIDLDNGQTNFDLRLITLDLSTQKLLFTDVLRLDSYQNINILYE